MTDRERHVVITGGAGDIGRAIAQRLLADGATVTLLDIQPPHAVREDLETLAEGLAARYLQADVRDHRAVSQALQSAAPFDVVIASAGVVQSAPFLDITPEQWQHQLDVNLTGCFNTGQAAARLMVARKHPGRIIFTSSWVQDRPWPEIAAYAVSKSGLSMLTRCMAAELAPHRILVNAIAPGIVAAGMARHQIETEPQYAARAARAIPLGELQTPGQVAGATAFLCSADAGYMTGSTLLIDGGCSLGVA
jgi:NAD(P)-dependent dehydrogenase (short-subunit alcohol dehydrogenase family)